MQVTSKDCRQVVIVVVVVSVVTAWQPPVATN